MTYWLSGYSSHAITARELAQVMHLLKAEFRVDSEAWYVKAKDAQVHVRLATEDLEFMTPEQVDLVVEALGERPRARVAFGYGVGGKNGMELQLIRAVCIALAERWPVVLDHHTGTVEPIDPPGVRRKKDPR